MHNNSIPFRREIGTERRLRTTGFPPPRVSFSSARRIRRLSRPHTAAADNTAPPSVACARPLAANALPQNGISLARSYLERSFRSRFVFRCCRARVTSSISVGARAWCISCGLYAIVAVELSSDFLPIFLVWNKLFHKKLHCTFNATAVFCRTLCARPYVRPHFSRPAFVVVFSNDLPSCSMSAELPFTCVRGRIGVSNGLVFACGPLDFKF
jgi:hypothetical protein